MLKAVEKNDKDFTDFCRRDVFGTRIACLYNCYSTDYDFVKFWAQTDENGKIISSEVIDNGGNGHHALPPYLKSLGIETLILGNRGQGAVDAIVASGLKEMPGITGSADNAAELFAKGELKPNFEAKCSHHGEHNSDYHN